MVCWDGLVDRHAVLHACRKKLGLARTKNLIVRAYYGIYRVTSFQFARTSFLRRTYVVPVVAKAVGAMFAKDRVTGAVVFRTHNSECRDSEEK